MAKQKLVAATVKFTSDAHMRLKMICAARRCTVQEYIASVTLKAMEREKAA